MFTSTIARRTAAAVAGGALAATGLGLVGPAPAAQAAPVNAEAQAAAAWLADQLGPAGLFTTGFDAVGTSIDFGLSLAATDADPATLATIVAGVEDNLESYIGTPEQTNASKLAKAAALLQAVGADLTDVGGEDLLDRLETAVDDETGQLGGFSDVYGQVWAVKVLDAADSVEADPATEYLISQKCAGGAWGYEFDGCQSVVDGTSYTLLALLPQADDDSEVAPAVNEAIAAAVTWLKGQQRADGGFGDWGVNKNGTTSEANGSGLAAWALGEAGETEEAAAAAVWVADHQLVMVPACSGGPVPGEVGAIAYDDQNIEFAIADGIEPADRATWIVAGSQALAGLTFLPARSSTVTVTGPTGYVRAGTTVSYTVSGVRPGQVACVTGFGTQQWKIGSGTVKAKLPAATGTRVLSLRLPDSITTATVEALAPKTMVVVLARSVVARGGTQTLLARGFVPGEPVAVIYRGGIVRRGVAGADGRFKTSFPVGRISGIKAVRVEGAFPVRRGTASFRVR